ncbi:MAG: HEAT repeat domain-containing protein [bacterium]|nr:HEAT repeat domain-containing protein [bacterium]
MKNKKIGGRKLKKRVAEYLQAEDFARGLCEICRLPARQVVNPLFSFLCSIDERIKWRAVTAMGKVISNLAESDLESARVIMRRFIWQLNDESGGIGWGCPESMAEAMVQNEILAEEFWSLLFSYIQPEGNYIEHPVLQRGVLWGVGRLAHNRPRHARQACAHLLPYMETADPILRGLAAWAAGPIAGQAMYPRLKKLIDDQGRLTVYCDGQMVQHSVGQLAQAAMESAEQRQF